MADRLAALVAAFEKGEKIAPVAEKRGVPPPAKGQAPTSPAAGVSPRIGMPVDDALLCYQGRTGGAFVFGYQRTGAMVLLDVDGPRTALVENAYPYMGDHAPGKGWLFAGALAGRPAAWVVRDPFTEPKGIEELPPFEDERRLGFEWAAWFDGAALLWPACRHPYPFQLPPVSWWPVLREGSSYRPLEELPPVASIAGPQVTIGKATLGNGSSVLIWQGMGYEKKDGRFVATFDLKWENSSVDWTSAPCGPDGFFFLNDRKLSEIHRGGEPIPHAPKVDNVMGIEPGPDGTLLLRLGQNKAKNVGVLYDPATRKATPIPKVFSRLVDGRVFAFATLEGLSYSDAGRVLVGVQKAVYTHPMEALAAASPSPKQAPPAKKAQPAVPAGARRFECVEDGASKFWEVSRDGAAMTVRFGRLGTDGQTKTKPFADEAAALKEVEKLVREKTGKGYRETT